ncbi:hypothetical protein RFI_24616, partial [Reticulomyxa filosa]
YDKAKEDEDKTNELNEWIPFIDKDSNMPIQIGRDEDNYNGVHAVIGGRDNHLLFITYFPKNIAVFDLETLRFVQHDMLPTNDSNACVYDHCFVSRVRRGANAIKKHDEMMLFCETIGLSIEYDEDSNAFFFRNLHVCSTLKKFTRYACVFINDAILFFGGYKFKIGGSKAVYKYSIDEDKWSKCDRVDEAADRKRKAMAF